MSSRGLLFYLSLLFLLLDADIFNNNFVILNSWSCTRVPNLHESTHSRFDISYKQNNKEVTRKCSVYDSDAESSMLPNSCDFNFKLINGYFYICGQPSDNDIIKMKFVATTNAGSEHKFAVSFFYGYNYVGYMFPDEGLVEDRLYLPEVQYSLNSDTTQKHNKVPLSASKFDGIYRNLVHAYSCPINADSCSKVQLLSPGNLPIVDDKFYLSYSPSDASLYVPKSVLTTYIFLAWSDRASNKTEVARFKVSPAFDVVSASNTLSFGRVLGNSQVASYKLQFYFDNSFFLKYNSLDNIWMIDQNVISLEDFQLSYQDFTLNFPTRGYSFVTVHTIVSYKSSEAVSHSCLIFDLENNKGYECNELYFKGHYSKERVLLSSKFNKRSYSGIADNQMYAIYKYVLIGVSILLVAVVSIVNLSSLIKGRLPEQRTQTESRPTA